MRFNQNEGRLGLPRLTSIGPFVKPSEVRPAHDLEAGIYDDSVLRSKQGKTHEDTVFAIEQTTQDLAFDRQIEDAVDIGETQWEYHQMQLSTLLEGNTFSRSLLTVMSRFEEKYGSFDMINLDPDFDQGEADNELISQEVLSQLRGEKSIFRTDEMLRNVNAFMFGAFERGGRDLEEGLEKTTGDFRRVLEINETIRSTREYWPPTVEKDASEQSGMNFGTIDGSHRTVALSQILGADQEIFVWEWINEDELIVRN